MPRLIDVLDQGKAPIVSELGEDAALYTDARIELIDEVDGLIASAPAAEG